MAPLDSRVLEKGAARQVLRQVRSIQSANLLLPAMLLIGLGALWHFRYDSTRPMDGVLRWSLVLCAFSIPIIVDVMTNGSRALLRRLPVDPAARLQARIQLTTAIGIIVLACFLLAEYFMTPVMMHPSFAGRLNPTEAETLARLPGVPLLRFTIDGEVSRGLASEASVAAISPGHRERAPGDGPTERVGIWNYGKTSPRSDVAYEPPEPGEVLATLARKDWPGLSSSERQRLRWLGVPAGVAVEIVLERYVSQDEYLAKPWRRDGLGRERRWHAFDRAVSFLGALILLTCTLIGKRSLSPLLYLAVTATVAASFLSDSGYLPHRPWLLCSNLEDGAARFPSFGSQQTVLENLIWPLFVTMACAVTYAASARQLRSAAGIFHRTNQRFVEKLRHYWRSRSLRLELLFVVLCVAVWLGPIFDSLASDFSVEVVWLLSWLAFHDVMERMTRKWARRDALLSRLPTAPAEVAWRRLGWVLIMLAVLALLPLAVAVAASHFSPGVHDNAQQTPPGTEGLAMSLLIGACGSLVMLPLLLDYRAIATLFMFAGIGVNVYSWNNAIPWLTPMGCAVLAVTLPAIHRLLRGHVERGRAPRLLDLLPMIDACIENPKDCDNRPRNSSPRARRGNEI